MAPYFGCFSCSDTRKGLRAIDMDKNDQVDWREFMVYVKWALHEYPDEIKNVDDLLGVTFRKGLIPAMQDEILGRSMSSRLVTNYKSRKHARRPRELLTFSGTVCIPQYRGMESADEDDVFHQMAYRPFNNLEYFRHRVPDDE